MTIGIFQIIPTFSKEEEELIESRLQEFYKYKNEKMANLTEITVNASIKGSPLSLHEEEIKRDIENLIKTKYCNVAQFEVEVTSEYPASLGIKKYFETGKILPSSEIK